MTALRRGARALGRALDLTVAAVGERRQASLTLARGKKTSSDGHFTQKKAANKAAGVSPGAPPAGAKPVVSSPTSASDAAAGSGVPRFAVLAGTAAASFGAWQFLDDEQRARAQFAFFGATAPVMRLMDPETAHNVGIALLAAGVAPLETRPEDPRLAVERWGLRFPNPVGLAAGFDKDAKAFPALVGMGFGFVEIGSVTPKPQPGNPKPRVFRLREHGAVINRYGFNSEGHPAARERLEAYRAGGFPTQVRVAAAKASGADGVAGAFGGPLGVNLGKNKLTPEASAVDDYVEGVTALGHTADYLVVNVSSPNTPGLRNLQSKKHLKRLMTRVIEARNAIEGGHKPPVLLKIAPDLEDADVANIAAAAKSAGVDGIIVSNTTVARPEAIAAHPHGAEAGGLSGKPLMDASTEMVSKMYRATGGKIPLVGCGGVSDGRDAYRKIRAGASLVQMYTAFAYQGPAMLPKMKEELATCLREDGFESVEDAVGADHRRRRR